MVCSQGRRIEAVQKTIVANDTKDSERMTRIEVQGKAQEKAGNEHMNKLVDRIAKLELGEGLAQPIGERGAAPDRSAQ